jgi:hypothetical protein
MIIRDGEEVCEIFPLWTFYSYCTHGKLFNRDIYYGISIMEYFGGRLNVKPGNQVLDKVGSLT